MPSSISRGLLLLAGLCCLVPTSQAKGAQGRKTSNDKHKHQKHPICQKMSHIIDNISFSLFRGLASWSETNILLSPVSIAAAIVMVSLGAKGDTHTQMLEGLGFNLTEIPEAKIHECFQHLHTYQQWDHQLQLTTGSSLFINESLGLKDKFIHDVQSLYHSEAISINFGDTGSAMKKINKHMEQKSQGTVVDLVKDLKKDTALALVNYIAFSGILNEEFQADFIGTGDFHMHNGNIVTVTMINRLGRFYLQEIEELSCWVLQHHYVDDVIAFFILPYPGKMWRLEQRLTHKHLDNIQRMFDIRFANVYFPKLTISGTYDLKSVLSTLGITKVFSNEADLSGVTEGAPLKLSKAVHRAVLTIDERETGTIGMNEFEEAWLDAPTIMFNRPFLVVLKNAFTNIPLFLGKVLNPVPQ